MDIIWAFEMMMVRERSVRRWSWRGVEWKSHRIYWEEGGIREEGKRKIQEDGKIWFEDGTTRPASVYEMSDDDLTAEDWEEWNEA